MSEAMPADALSAAVAAVHAALDRWHSVVQGVGAESGDVEDALADPRLEASEALFADALSEFHGAAGVVLGLRPDDDDDDDIDEEIEGDVFILQFFVGLSEGTPPTALDRVIEVLDAGGLEVVTRLESAGFVVPTFAASRGELPVALLEEIEDDDPEGDVGPDDAGDGRT